MGITIFLKPEKEQSKIYQRMHECTKKRRRNYASEPQ
jgi:hypothetical protein